MVYVSLLFGTVLMAAPGDPPLAHYADSLTDSSGSGHDATPVGGVDTVPGLKGDALRFDGVSSVAEIPLDIEPSTGKSQTWSVWIYPESTDGRRQIISLDDGGFDRSLLIEDGQLAVFTGSRCQQVAVQITARRWQHLAAVFYDGKILLYLDGREVAQVTEDLQSDGGTFGVPHLGASSLRQDFYHGLMDEVLFLPYALSSEGVKTTYSELASAADLSNAKTLASDPADVMSTTPNAMAAGPGTSPKPADVKVTTVEAGPPAAVVPEGPVKENVPDIHQEKPPGKSEPSSVVYRSGGPVSRLLSLTLLGNDPQAIAALLCKERWNNPIEVVKADFELPATRDASGKQWRGARLQDFRGQPLLMLFYSGGGKDSDQGKALEMLAKISETEAAAKAKLGCVVVTPFGAEMIKKDFDSRGIRVRVLNDPTDEIRRQMKLYSTPMVLLDKEGAIVWKNRVGQRGARPPQPDGVFRFDSGDLDAALDKLCSGALVYAKTSPSMVRLKPVVSMLFDFESGAGDWLLSGNSWGTGGAASEMLYPGLVKGYHGMRWLSSFAGNGIAGTGVAISPEFVIAKRYLHFTVGGGDLLQNAGVALVCGESTIQISCGENTFEMKPVTWDLAKYAGKSARLIVYDAGKFEQRDGIMVDAFAFSDSPQFPESLSDLHDPNKLEHAARVAGCLPEEWKALQNGNFHITSAAGRTFRLEWMYQVRPVSERPMRFRVEFDTFPNTVAQKIHEQTFEVRDSKRAFPAVAEPTEKAMVKSLLASDVRPSARDETNFPVRHHMLATANVLTLQAGPSPNFEPLPEESVRALTKSGSHVDPLNHPEFQAMVAREGLERWPEEKEPAYLLRCWRWLQRYWTDFDTWGGWPTSNPNAIPVVQEWERKSLSCPAVGALTALMRNAGIPAIDGQGLWANEDGNTCTPHVRSLIFLDRVGWIQIDDHKQLGSSLGPFTFGTTWGDNYLQALDDNSIHYKKHPASEAVGEPNNAAGQTWWRSWKGIAPDKRPL